MEERSAPQKERATNAALAGKELELVDMEGTP
jgi:hypothetical protein